MTLGSNAPNFLYAALERTACAALFKESRMKTREPSKLHRKSGNDGFVPDSQSNGFTRSCRIVNSIR
jgi:hypothetical protein